MKHKIVIIGGGAVGTSAAYYITKHPSYDPQEDSVTIIEPNCIASGSSGKGGGLIASWAEPECLAIPSFKLHQELATAHNGTQRWGYRRVSCADCILNTVHGTSEPNGSIESPHTQKHVLPEQFTWIDPSSVVSYDPVGTEDNTAQCDPFSFTSALFEEARHAGVQLLRGTARKLEPIESLDARVAVSYTDDAHSEPQQLMATHVIVAAGPWSSSIIPEASVSGARCHSLVLRPDKPLTNNLLFLDVTHGTEREPRHLTPEVYPRADGTVYACEAADPTWPLPPSSAEVVVDSEACDRIYAATTAISEPLRKAELQRKQVCYQPIVIFKGQRKKLVGPFLGETSTPGAYLACGHDSWGISNAPATGKALSELIFDGKSVSVEIESLSISIVMSRAKR